jgi:phage tail sheath gpL-like
VTVSFNSISSSLRVPFVAAEFDNSRAQQGPALLPYRALLIGQKTSSGTATANTIVRVSNESQVRTFAGPGSLLHRMAIAWFANNRSTEVYIGVLADNGSGVAASGTLTVTGPATASGTLSLYIGGTLVQVAVASGDAQNTIATAIGAAITANTDLPVTASVTTNVVTVTAKPQGHARQRHRHAAELPAGEATPAGVAVAIVALASGATNPVLTTLIAAMGDTQFQ